MYQFAKIHTMNNRINSIVNTHKLVLCSNILVRSGDFYLVLKRSSDKKYAPNVVVPYGGKIEPNEDPLVAANSELEEESGIKAINIKLAAIVTEIHNSPKMLGNWLSYYFIGDYESGDIANTPEGIGLKLTKQELISSLLFPSFREILPYILQEITPIIAVMNYNDKQELQNSNITPC